MQRKRFFFILFLLSLTLFVSFEKPNQEDAPAKDFVVVLDAGHGGHDPGNLGNGYLEKNIALKIVLQAGAILEKQPGVKVVYTRKDDTFVDLYVRGEIANKANADLFVSVHCDSHTSNANGAGTFVLGLHANKQNFEIAKKENSVIYLEDNYESRYAKYDINSPESIIGLTIMQEEFLEKSIQLASLMQENFSNRLKRNDRKVKQAGFIVLHQTFMPSVLVETGFLTNKSEGMYLNSRKGQTEIGKAIADAIVAYKNGVTVESAPAPTPAVATQQAPEVEQVVEPPVEEAKKEVKEKATEVAEAVVQKSEPAKTTTNSPPAKAPVAEKLPKTEPAVKPTSEVAVKKEPETKPAEPAKSAEAKLDQQTENTVAAVTKELNTPQAVEEDSKKEVAKASPPPPAKEEVTKSDPPKKEEVVKKEVEKTATASKTPPAKKTKPDVNIVFKVQLLASSKDLPLRAEDFKGLNTLSKEPYKNLFRYMYGNTESYFQATLYKSNADAKGYTTSFIVAYKDGVRIPIKEALNYVSE